MSLLKPALHRDSLHQLDANIASVVRSVSGDYITAPLKLQTGSMLTFDMITMAMTPGHPPIDQRSGLVGHPEVENIFITLWGQVYKFRAPIGIFKTSVERDNVRILQLPDFPIQFSQNAAVGEMNEEAASQAIFALVAYLSLVGELDVDTGVLTIEPTLRSAYDNEDLEKDLSSAGVSITLAGVQLG